MRWYERTKRWCQTNLTEIDGKVCDVSVWKAFWQRNQIDGIIVNAGGIVAYYPSENPLQYRSPYLAQRDLLGEFVRAAREADLTVVARMDCNRADEACYRAHPDWFSVDAEGQPYMADGRYIACVNGEYDKTYIPKQLLEIIRRYSPDGFADNSWQGLPASKICYCQTCRDKFHNDCGLNLPAAADWNDETYRRWVKWSIDCRMENWRLFNDVTRNAKEDCLWLGMVNADPVNAHCSMYDLHQIGHSMPFLMVDHQSRDALNGFEQNLVNGLLLHALCPPGALLAESMAHYARGVYTFRRSAMPPLELQLWMMTGIAGGISPWLHIVGAVQEDKRQLFMDEDLMDWHARHQAYLENRVPVASVGLVWSQQNVTFYGRDCAEQRCGQPWRGFVHALIRARIPFVPVCAADIPTAASQIRLLILPDVAVMTDEQLSRLQAFMQSGGYVLATGATGMLDELGMPRSDHHADALLGIWREELQVEEAYRAGWEHDSLHTYLRIEQPEHALFKPFANTSILPFGGWRQPIKGICAHMRVLATYIPAFPYYPPEFAYMSQAHTDLPLILAGDSPFGGRVMVLAADIDRRYGQAALPDHGDLLEAAVRWLLPDGMPMEVEGNGYLATVLYRQGNRRIVHIVNLSGSGVSPGFAEQTYPIDGIVVRLKAEEDTVWKKARALVSCKELPMERRAGEWAISLETLHMHECIVIE